MGIVQALVSTVMTIFLYTVLVAAVWKIFQIASDLSEIKKLLAEKNRTAPAPAAFKLAPAPQPIPDGPISLESAEALLREVAAESHALEQSKTTV
jgi:hypothetical protein